jgi:hypothetical protein
MTARALTAAALATLAIAGCGADGASTPPPKASTAAAAPSSSSTTATAPAPRPAAVAVLDDPRAPSTPALRRAARAFFAGYVAYIYGEDDRLPAPATEQLRRELAATGPVAGLEDLRPRLRELRLAPISVDVWAVSASVDDGREDGQLQTIPARMTRVDGRWLASSVAEGEG